jgi:hypothetical protein
MGVQAWLEMRATRVHWCIQVLLRLPPAGRLRLGCKNYTLSRSSHRPGLAPSVNQLARPNCNPKEVLRDFQASTWRGQAVIQKGFHHRGHRGHGEQTEKKPWVNKQGNGISTRASRNAFLCGLYALCGESFLRGARRGWLLELQGGDDDDEKTFFDFWSDDSFGDSDGPADGAGHW